MKKLLLILQVVIGIVFIGIIVIYIAFTDIRSITDINWYGASNIKGVPILVIVYACVGMGAISILNILLKLDIVKSLPISQGQQMKLFFIGLVIIYGIALYYGYSNPSLPN